MKHGFLEGPIRAERLCVLAPYYQFFRTVLFALEHGRPCVLMSDTRNPAFDNRGLDGQQARRGQLPLLRDFVPQSVRSQVKTVTVQEIVAAIKASGRHEWIPEFEKKYGLGEEESGSRKAQIS